MEPYEAVGPRRDRRPQAWARGIAAIGDGDSAWPQGQMREGVARVDIADAHLETR
jgi:hypothetical protein